MGKGTEWWKFGSRWTQGAADAMMFGLGEEAQKEARHFHEVNKKQKSSMPPATIRVERPKRKLLGKKKKDDAPKKEVKEGTSAHKSAPVVAEKCGNINPAFQDDSDEQ